MSVMMVLMLLLRLVNLFAAALVAGGQVCVLFVIIPTKRQFATRTSVEVHNAMLGHQIDYYMKPSGIISGVTGLLLLGLGLFFGHEFRLGGWSIVFYCLGLWGTAGVIICSRFFNVVTNAMMIKWDLDNIPENYPAVRARWDLVHTIRASHGVLGFVGYTLAALTAGFGGTISV